MGVRSASTSSTPIGSADRRRETTTGEVCRGPSSAAYLAFVVRKDDTVTPEPSLWDRKLAENPDHSRWYVQRFRDLAAAGKDLVGEARLIDAMARGELGGRLTREFGHDGLSVEIRFPAEAA